MTFQVLLQSPGMRVLPVILIKPGKLFSVRTLRMEGCSGSVVLGTRSLSGTGVLGAAPSSTWGSMGVRNKTQAMNVLTMCPNHCTSPACQISLSHGIDSLWLNGITKYVTFVSTLTHAPPPSRSQKYHCILSLGSPPRCFWLPSTIHFVLLGLGTKFLISGQACISSADSFSLFSRPFMN